MVNIRVMFLMLSVMFLFGCAHPWLGTYPPLDRDFDLPSDYTYIIGPRDSLQIFVWDNPDISRGVTVRPDGKINTPLLDDLVASGKTPSELARDIEKGLSKYVRDPMVAVMVGGFNGVYYQQVRIVGEIGGGDSGGGRAFPYDKEMTLLDLMIKAGGLSQYADGNRASIIRIVDGEQQQFGIRIDDLLEDGDLTANIKIQPGDILFIPEAFF